MPDFEEKIAACEKKHKKQHYTFTTEPPPKDWSIAVADIVQVDIDGVGFVPALLPLSASARHQGLDPRRLVRGQAQDVPAQDVMA